MSHDLDKYIEGERSFVTGSYAYGMPASHSDIDLCVLMDIVTLNALRELADSKATKRSAIEEGEPTECLSDSLRFGKLNLLCFVDNGLFEVWKNATQFLKKKKPVTRNKAIKFIKKKMKRYLEESNDN